MEYLMEILPSLIKGALITLEVFFLVLYLLTTIDSHIVGCF